MSHTALTDLGLCKEISVNISGDLLKIVLVCLKFFAITILLFLCINTHTSIALYL